jgi:hypothetical protein
VNRATRMFEVLRDGQRHSRRDLIERCGFFLTNNAASELRAQGYDVEQTRERVNGDVVYFYRLRGSLSEPEQSDPVRVASTGAALLGDRDSGSDSEQLVASSPTPPLSGGSLLPNDDGKHDHAHVGRGGAEEESEQVPLFTYPRSPAWS